MWSIEGSIRVQFELVQIRIMEKGSALSLFPLHRSKTIHLVRHGQGIHNVEGDKNPKSMMSHDYFDAHLTQLGWQQVDKLHQHVSSSGLINKVELVITSPLLRAIQTAVGAFGDEGYADGMDILPLMVANAGNSDHAAISNRNCPPILAVELCREHLGVRPCDKRRSIDEYKCLFPAVDFSLIENNDDVLWKADVRETNEEVAARGINFLNWLFTRKEKEIAVVTHSGFLFHTFAALGNDCHPLLKKEISTHFANCELRSMAIVNTRYAPDNFASAPDNVFHSEMKSPFGSLTDPDYSTVTNNPGNIPSSSTHLPSHVAAD